MFELKPGRAAALILTFSLTILAGVTIAEAKVVELKGTRSQVHAACEALGLKATDSAVPGVVRSGSTTCLNEAEGTAITCDDNSVCEAIVPRYFDGFHVETILG